MVEHAQPQNIFQIGVNVNALESAGCAEVIFK